MLLFVTILHLIIAVLLIGIVLIQDSKGGGVFGMGSGGSNQVFSATGAANFLVKATRALAIAFAATCIGLTWMTSHKSGSATDDFVPAATSTPPAAAAPENKEETSAPTTGESEQKAPANETNK